MNVGIHIQPRTLGEKGFTRLRQAQPDCITTVLSPDPDFDQVGVHRRLRAEHPAAVIVARLAPGPTPQVEAPDAYGALFASHIDALQQDITWFEVDGRPNGVRAEGSRARDQTPTELEARYFGCWIEAVLGRLVVNHPWASWVFPGSASERFDLFWELLLPTIRTFDAWGIRCYWEGDADDHLDHGQRYARAHGLLPDRPIIVTEGGDITPGRDLTDKVRRHARWYAAADQQPYLLGAALRLAEAVAPVVTRSATAGEDLTEEMAAAVSEVERKPRWPLVADGFDFPVAKPDGTGYYVASGLAEEPYFERFKFWHTGEDWNDVRGGDSDLGAPVYTVAHGRVVTARYFRPSWGNVILIEHVLEDGTTVWSQYAHLQDRYVRKGDIVWRGQKIGTIGKGADDRWIAHLHFEIRTRELPASKWGWTTAEDREAVLQHYAHPTEFIKSRRPLQEMVMLTVDDEGTDAFTRSESEHWFSAKAGHDGQTWWTWTVSEEQGEDCVATWQPKLDRSGMYEIYAFIPRNCATTEQARYQITHRRGVDTAVVAQSDYFDEWVSLGAYPLSTEMQAHVRLSDVTGEPYTRDEGQRKQIAFDATLWILVEADV